MEQINVCLGNRLKKLREHLGFKQEIVARMTGINVKTLSRIERGKLKNIKGTYLAKLSKVYNKTEKEIENLEFNEDGSLANYIQNPTISKDELLIQKDEEIKFLKEEIALFKDLTKLLKKENQHLKKKTPIPISNK